jgi:hypothetical protein
MAKRTPGIPATDLAIDARIRSVLDPIKEIVEIREGVRGNMLRRTVTLGMLVKLGIITIEQARAVENDE